MLKLIVRFTAVIAIAVSVCGTASAATTASQGFTVVVPQNITITAPPAVSLTHDQTDSPQAFPPQSWTVKGNSNAGVNVVFATSDAFTHVTNPTFKRNAKLGLALGAVQGPATWSVGVAEDTTDFASNDGVAQVTASSSGVGRASFNLSVTFITEEFGIFAAGDYTTTVVGTVAAN